MCFTYTQQISLMRIYTYRAVMAYFVLNIQLGPVLDEDLHHLQMAFRCGGYKRGPSLLSETDTHSERDTTACHHTLPTYRQLSICIHTYIHTVCISKDSCASICYCIHTYIHTLWASTHTAHTEIHRSYIHEITFPCTYIDTNKHPN